MGQGSTCGQPLTVRLSHEPHNSSLIIMLISLILAVFASADSSCSSGFKDSGHKTLSSLGPCPTGFVPLPTSGANKFKNCVGKENNVVVRKARCTAPDTDHVWKVITDGTAEGGTCTWSECYKNRN